MTELIKLVETIINDNKVTVHIVTTKTIYSIITSLSFTEYRCMIGTLNTFNEIALNVLLLHKRRVEEEIIKLEKARNTIMVSASIDIEQYEEIKVFIENKRQLSIDLNRYIELLSPKTEEETESSEVQ